MIDEKGTKPKTKITEMMILSWNSLKNNNFPREFTVKTSQNKIMLVFPANAETNINR